MKLPGAADEGEGEGEAAAAPLIGVPDIAWEMDKFKWASMGFSDAETYAIQCSMRHLATTPEMTEARFWGKILGTKKYYYIAECRGPAYVLPDDNPPEIEEANGERGLNRFTYWVTTEPYAVQADWTMLPYVTKEHIKQARKIKKLFTGDLKAPVISHPHFAGNEEWLLRTQIARISASTILAMKGQYKVEGDEGAELITSAEEEGEGDGAGSRRRSQRTF